MDTRSQSDEDALARILKRAQELSQLDDHPTVEPEDEIFASIRDGLLGFEEIDEETLGKCIDRFGSQAVVEAFREGQEARSSKLKITPSLSTTESGQQMKSTESTQSALSRPSRSFWAKPSSWLGIAATFAIAGILAFVFFSDNPPVGPDPGTEFVLQWPEKPTFEIPAGETVLRSDIALAQTLPDFDAPGTGGVLGAGDNPFTPWQLSTVIVRTESGYGSGAFISADGWLLTNYHVVASAAQAASVTGRPAQVSVISAQILDDKVKPNTAVTATVYRVNPLRDLALLKLDRMPPGMAEVPHFAIAESYKEGDDCYVIGSQGGGPAWWVRGAILERVFDFPGDLSEVAAGLVDGKQVFRNERTDMQVLVTDASISGGDSGGPLLDESGHLIGLTFATSSNQSSGSVGWHIALPHIKEFTKSLPEQPEGVPFDPWCAGDPHAALLEPVPGDQNRDGVIDLLSYRFVTPPQEEGGEPAPFALTLFIDLRGLNRDTNPATAFTPSGLWGMEDSAGFNFDVFLTIRADGLAMVGYTGEGGYVDEIRIGPASTGATQLVWERQKNGTWVANNDPKTEPLIDARKLGAQLYGELEQLLKGSPFMVQGDGNAGDARQGAAGPNVIR